MAKRLQTNIEGSFYVNDRCIDCDTCRQLAPETFAPVQGYSAVVCQPQTDEARKSANHALLACPVAAIVSETKEGLVSDMRDFPLQLDHNVYYCGYTSEKSYGGSSYFINHPEGNCLVDAPRFVPSLAKRL
jgi:ferredoxin